MPGTKGDELSMFETVKLQGAQLDEHGNILRQHADEISLLKKSDEDIMHELKGMKMDFTRIENTILKSAQATQEVLSTQNLQQWDLIKILNSGNQEDKARKHDLTKTKLEKFWEFAGKLMVILLGSGGFFYVLLELATK